MKKLLTLSITLLIPVMILGQTSGKIAGTVTDEDGNPLAGANVVVVGTSSGAASGDDGSFVILNVSGGIYSLRVDYIGYKTTVISNIDVKVGLTTQLKFELSASVIEGDEVLIVAQKRLIEPSATNSVRSVGAEEIQNSASRSVTGMLDLQPGIVIQNGELHIRGSREEEVGYTLDGADIKDPIYSGRMMSAIPEALSEIAVEAGGYGADVGGGNSGVIRQTMRTGGSNFSGTGRFENGDYGHQDITATAGGPLGPVKYFLAIRKEHEDDYDPTFYDGFSIENGALLPSYIAGVTADGDSVSVVFDPEAGIKSRWSDDLSVNSTALLDLGPLNLRFSMAHNTSNWMSNSLPIFSMFNDERLPEGKLTQLILGVRANFFLNPNFLISGGFSTLSRNYESYDALFGAPGNFGDALAWGDSASVAAKTDASAWQNAYTSPEYYYVGQFAFSRPGDIRTGWSKSNRGTFAFDIGATIQRDKHELKAGFERKNYTYRSYYLSTGAIATLNRNIFDGDYTREAATSGTNSAATADLKQSNRGGNIGYDDYGKEINDEWNGPREPWSQSFYVNDKYEGGDLVVNFGVRVDQFNMDDWKMKDPTNPGWDETGQTIVEEEFLPSDTRTVVQPRLGLAFPVSDKTVFHLQYGKYAQMPELGRPYASTRYMHLVWGGQNYTPDPMGFDLDPIETTQYEIGLSYLFLNDAALDVTAFAKNTTGQIVISKNRDVPVNNTYGVDSDALYYDNGDFSTINGVELTLRTRRINRLQVFGSYTWSDARGVNSDPNSSAGNLVQEALAAPPAMIMPLYYENKHRGAVALDYRFGEKDGGLLLSNVGVNLQYKFNSGHPYTLSDGGMGQRSADSGALLDDARAREPQEPIGKSTTPWNKRVNLKIDKTMNVSGFGVTVFAYIENVFNTKNVLNVYARSGNAYDDGFLSDPSLSSEIVAAQGDTYVSLYENVNLANRQHYMWDFGQDLFGSPRVIRLGASVNF